MNKRLIDYELFWWIAVPFAVFMFIISISIYHSKYVEGDLACYSLAYKFHNDVDIGSQVKTDITDKFLSSGECSRLEDSINNIGEVRQKHDFVEGILTK
jgi:hypothetical protein